MDFDKNTILGITFLSDKIYLYCSKNTSSGLALF